jgi:hypothetical protein
MSRYRKIILALINSKGSISLPHYAIQRLLPVYIKGQRQVREHGFVPTYRLGGHP